MEGSRSRRMVIVLIGALSLVLIAGATALAAKGLKTRSSTIEIEPTDYGSTTPKCKKGTKAVSGGFETELDATFTGASVFVDQSSRSGNRKWKTEAIGLGGDEGDLTAYTYCRDQQLKRKSATTEVDPSENGSVTATCKRGTKAFSGGFDADQFDVTAPSSPWFWLIQSMKEGKRKWTVTARNSGSLAGDLTAYVYCHEGKALKTKQAEETMATDLATETAQAKCSRKQRVVSGGFDTDSDWATTGAWVTESRKTGQRSWSVAAEQAAASDPHDLIAYAYCEKK